MRFVRLGDIWEILRTWLLHVCLNRWLIRNKNMFVFRYKRVRVLLYIIVYAYLLTIILYSAHGFIFSGITIWIRWISFVKLCEGYTFLGARKFFQFPFSYIMHYICLIRYGFDTEALMDVMFEFYIISNLFFWGFIEYHLLECFCLSSLC